MGGEVGTVGIELGVEVGTVGREVGVAVVGTALGEAVGPLKCLYITFRHTLSLLRPVVHPAR